jgi:quinoprotein glucose dehydrogenase
MDLVVDGKPVKAVAQPTKQNWLYVFDRVTGKPVWPIEERAVEKGDVPGEWYSPTQPLCNQASRLRASGCDGQRPDRLHTGASGGSGKLVSQYKIGPIFTRAVGQQVGRPARHADAA